MAPGAKHEDLIYVTNANNNTVSVYSWSRRKLVGMLHGINAPFGVCSDRSGDVWVVGWGKNEIFEYAHAGTKPLTVLPFDDPDANLTDCSVDPTTGDLAVTNWGYNWLKGYVLIYPHAGGKPKYYTGPGLWFYYGCTYDDKGNLFADGWQAYVDDVFSLDELKRGASKFRRLELIPTIYPTLIGGVRWDGRYLAVGDMGDLYLYGVDGGTADVRGYVPLTTRWPLGLFSIVTIDGARRVVGPDTAGNPTAVQSWNYPAGGTPTGTITHALDWPYGAAVSLLNKKS